MKYIFIIYICLTGLTLKAEDYPIIFVHGHKSEAVPEDASDKRKGGWKTWNPTDIYGNPTYHTAMTEIINSHYGSYTAGSPLDCHKNTILSSTNGNTKVVYNFSYYHPNGSPGMIGNDAQVLVYIDETYDIAGNHCSKVIAPYMPGYPP